MCQVWHIKLYSCAVAAVARIVRRQADGERSLAVGNQVGVRRSKAPGRDSDQPRSSSTADKHHMWTAWQSLASSRLQGECGSARVNCTGEGLCWVRSTW